MSTTMNRPTYEQLIRENIEWLRKQPRTLEREHIIAIILDSITRIYGSAETGGEKACGWCLGTGVVDSGGVDHNNNPIDRPCGCRPEVGAGGASAKSALRSLIQAIENCAITDSGPNGVNADRLRAALVSAKVALSNFPRSSQNQTVSSGVEGAHEGTTADDKGESREPEKLNNAHNDEAEKFLADYYGSSEGMFAEGEVIAAMVAFANSRLAESSLSSPPRLLPADKSLGDVPHFGCGYPQGVCDCYGNNILD